MKTVAVIPVRMNSVRLPGKVMMHVLGKPLLGHLLDRVQLCPFIDEIVVAAPVSADNDCIQVYCEERGVLVFRGAEYDVLDRLLGACVWRDAHVGVMIFGDGPMIDPQIITEIVGTFLDTQTFDWVGNDLLTSWPSGMEVEAFRVKALAEASSNCKDPEVREHSTLCIRQDGATYALHNVEPPPAFHRKDLSFEVDVDSDFQVVKTLLESFEGRADLSLGELISFMDRHPDLALSTRDIPRKWTKFRKSSGVEIK